MIDSCYLGDVRDGLRAFIAAGIRAQTCVTSPPYWGLRDYGTAQWDGGDPACDHVAGMARQDTERETPGGRGGSFRGGEVQFRDVCGKCGARRIDRQLGLESSPAEYIATMVDVFRLVRDALADDGTLWLNLGDSYAGSWGAQSRPQTGLHEGMSARQIEAHPKQTNTGSIPPGSGLKPKDLVGIPWRVAFALQADGWYLRSDVIWHKPNPMPESVTDRPTKAHEYLFLLAKSERYYYDAAAIAEPVSAASLADGRTARGTRGTKGEYAAVDGNCGFDPSGRNRRTVWTVATQPYADAHFATFPTALIEPCILAGSRVGDVVLDPFLGSGTTAQVAQSLGRRWIGCELNPEYHSLQRKRAAQRGLELVA